MGGSKIEWCEQTWNPTTGCNKVSAGCKNCYAETLAKRLQGMGAPGYEYGFDLTLHESRLNEPRRRKKPTMYFVNSMSDLFHECIPWEFLDEVFKTIRATPWHQYQILTKRPQNMLDYCKDKQLPFNAWMGVSVENRTHGLPRIELLRQVQCAVRFLSCEPLLEDLGELDLTGIHWVIVGGESGKQARPMDISWARSIRHQCQEQGVAFFFKQWGTFGADGERSSKHKNGRHLDGQTWDEMPRMPPIVL